MISGQDIKNIQLLALEAVEDPDADATRRRICRWYSKEFSTPLHFVENDLPFADVLRHYLESNFLEMYRNESEEGQRAYAAMRDDIIFGSLSEEEKAQIEKEDDEWAAQMVAEIEEQERKAAKNKKKQPETKNPNIKEETTIISRSFNDPPPKF